MTKLKKWLYGGLSHMTLLVALLWSFYTFRIKNQVEVVGRENLPHDTSILYVSNHLTLIDSFAIGYVVISFWEALIFPKRIPWNAPDRKNFLSHRLWKNLFNLLKNIPVARGERLKLHTIWAQVRLFVRALKNSNLILFFEGTRSRDGQIGDCRSGVSETVRQARPKYVVPIFLEGLEQIMPIEAGFSYHGIASGKRGRIVIGQPIDFSDLDMDDRHVRKTIGRRIKQAVVNLKTHCV